MSRKRLTERDAYWFGEEFWASAREPDEEEIDNIYMKLKDYEDAEEQGLLVRLPCKYVYFLVDVNSKWGGMVMKKPIKDLTLFEIEQVDKRKYYSTKEEAEAALERMNGDA